MSTNPELLRVTAAILTRCSKEPSPGTVTASIHGRRKKEIAMSKSSTSMTALAVKSTRAKLPLSDEKAAHLQYQIHNSLLLARLQIERAQERGLDLSGIDRALARALRVSRKLRDERRALVS
jgi:hypothetical protein